MVLSSMLKRRSMARSGAVRSDCIFEAVEALRLGAKL